jgi:hypothetical protein
MGGKVIKCLANDTKQHEKKLFPPPSRSGGNFFTMRNGNQQVKVCVKNILITQIDASAPLNFLSIYYAGTS